MGTAMGTQYQRTDVQASMPGLTMPEQVSVALAEIAESATEGLLALAVAAGLQLLGLLMEESVDAPAGPKGASTTRTGPRCATATSGLGDPWWPPGGGPAAAGARR
jgi:hypothetical protein